MSPGGISTGGTRVTIPSFLLQGSQDPSTQRPGEVPQEALPHTTQTTHSHRTSLGQRQGVLLVSMVSPALAPWRACGTGRLEGHVVKKCTVSSFPEALFFPLLPFPPQGTILDVETRKESGKGPEDGPAPVTHPHLPLALLNSHFPLGICRCPWVSVQSQPEWGTDPSLVTSCSVPRPQALYPTHEELLLELRRKGRK